MPSRKTVSLYYRAGTSDKVYNIQLEPSGSGWVVNFQYGRRTAGAWPNKTKTPTPLSYLAAELIYDDLVEQKTTKVDPYRPGVLIGLSLPSAAPPMPVLVLPPVPASEALEYFYAQAATFLGKPSTLHTAPEGFLVLLADIASGMQEGVSEAVWEVKRSADDTLLSLLTEDTRHWLAKLAGSDQTQLLSELQEVCLLH